MRPFITVILGSFALLVQAQDSTRYLSNGKFHVSGAGGMLFQAGTVPAQNDLHVHIGGGGGLLIDRRFLIGAFGMGLSSYTERYLPTDSVDRRANLEIDQSGVLVQYAFTPSRPVHPFACLQVGWGRARWNFDDDNDDNNGNNGDQSNDPSDLSDRITVITPSAGVQLNITHWFRPDIYVGWRFVSGLDLRGMDADDLSGFFFGVNAFFGGMGDRR